jgi:hypothetical protein
LEEPVSGIDTWPDQRIKRQGDQSFSFHDTSKTLRVVSTVFALNKVVTNDLPLYIVATAVGNQARSLPLVIYTANQ